MNEISSLKKRQHFRKQRDIPAELVHVREVNSRLGQQRENPFGTIGDSTNGRRLQNGLCTSERAEFPGLETHPARAVAPPKLLHPSFASQTRRACDQNQTRTAPKEMHEGLSTSRQFAFWFERDLPSGCDLCRRTHEYAGSSATSSTGVAAPRSTAFCLDCTSRKIRTLASLKMSLMIGSYRRDTNGPTPHPATMHGLPADDAPSKRARMCRSSSSPINGPPPNTIA